MTKYVSIIEDQDQRLTMVEFSTVKDMANHYDVTPSCIYARIQKPVQVPSSTFGTDSLFKIRKQEKEDFIPHHQCKNCYFSCEEGEDFCICCRRKKSPSNSPYSSSASDSSSSENQDPDSD